MLAAGGHNASSSEHAATSTENGGPAAAIVPIAVSVCNLLGACVALRAALKDMSLVFSPASRKRGRDEDSEGA